MLNTEKIVFDEPIYWMPNFNGSIKVSILKLLDDGRVLVRQYSEKKDLKPYYTQIAHLYNCAENAAKGRRAWEASKRKKARGDKNDRRR